MKRRKRHVSERLYAHILAAQLPEHYLYMPRGEDHLGTVQDEKGQKYIVMQREKTSGPYDFDKETITAMRVP